MTVYLASYKGRKTGHDAKACVARLADGLVRLATGGLYSHCEIAIRLSDGQYRCFSASLRDGGVRMKLMPLPSDKWDLIQLPDKVAVSAASLYARTQNADYDLIGAIGVLAGFGDDPDRWFCSEWCAAAVGLDNPASYSPTSLASVLKTL